MRINGIAALALIACAVLIAVSYGCGGRKDDRAGGKKVRTIAVIPKATSHEFWKSIHAGAVAASREAGVKIIWKGPIRELKASLTSSADDGVDLGDGRAVGR